MRLYERLQVGDYPTKKNLIEATRELGEDISERSLDRYRENMFHEFGWKITYNRINDGYVLIAEEDAQDPKVLHEIFGQSIRASFLTSVIQPGSKEIVLFENRSDYPGIQYLNGLYEACKEKKEITLKHRKFGGDSVQEYLVYPLFLKEFQGRWYVVGWVPERNDFRSFGLERIVEFKMLPKTFKAPNGIDAFRDTYKNMVGLNTEKGKVETVRIKFTGIGVAYERTLPQHYSGKEIESGEDWAIFEYQVIPNFEFLQRILSQADRVEVLSPLILRHTIRMLLEVSLKKHS